jgi:hypothetical protein
LNSVPWVFSPKIASNAIEMDEGQHTMANKNDRVKLEMKIMKYRLLARQAPMDDETAQRIGGLVSELQQKLREIDE